MMMQKDLQSRLPRVSPYLSGVGGRLSVAAIVLALAMVLVVLVSGGALACQSNAPVVAATAVVSETQAVEQIEESVLYAVPGSGELRRTHDIRAPGKEGNALGCCGRLHAPGTGCSGASCTSCFTATVPTAVAAHVSATTSGCLWVRVASAASLSPASLFRPPRLDV